MQNRKLIEKKQVDRSSNAASPEKVLKRNDIKRKKAEDLAKLKNNCDPTKSK